MEQTKIPKICFIGKTCNKRFPSVKIERIVSWLNSGFSVFSKSFAQNVASFRFYS